MVTDIGRTEVAAMSKTLMPIKFQLYAPHEHEWLLPFVYDLMEPTNPLQRAPSPDCWVWTACAYNVETETAYGLTWAIESKNASDIYLFVQNTVTPLLQANIERWAAILS